MPQPIIYKSTRRVRFSELDPYQHMSTDHFAGIYMEHRHVGLRENVGWDLKTLNMLPFAIWIRRMDIEFLRPVAGDQELTITSFVKEFKGPEAHIECEMIDANGKKASRCMMIAFYIEKRTLKPADWPAETMAMFFEKEAL